MDEEKQPLLVRFKQLLQQINQAQAERNPFTASSLKKQIEAQVEPMALEAMKMLQEHETHFEYLQLQITRLNNRLSQRGS